MIEVPKKIREVLERYGLDARESCWYSSQAKQWILRHQAAETIGDRAGVVMRRPKVLKCRLGPTGGCKDSVVALYGEALIETAPDKFRDAWATGEASPANNRNQYPLAMAEKRLKDRLILKLVFSGMDGALHSDAEADFTRDSPDAPVPTPEVNGVVEPTAPSGLRVKVDGAGTVEALMGLVGDIKSTSQEEREKLRAPFAARLATLSARARS